jgi:hypothetical protein
VAPVGWWNNTKYLNKKELIPVPYTNMAAISLFWYTNMAAVTSDENDLLELFSLEVQSTSYPGSFLLARGGKTLVDAGHVIC